MTDAERDLRKVLADILLFAVLHPQNHEFEIVRRSVLDQARMMIDEKDLGGAARRERERFAKRVEKKENEDG